VRALLSTARAWPLTRARARIAQVSAFELVDVALPAGLALDADTGVIQGVPTETCAPTEVPVRCLGAGGEAVAVLPVAVGLGLPVFAYPALDGPLQLQQDMQALVPETSGSPADEFRAEGLPEGLVIDPATGAISGTPLEVFDGTVMVSATNGAGTATAAVPLAVADLPPDVEYPPVEAVVGQQLQPVLPASRGGAVESFAVDPDLLPPGLVLDPATGALSGVPAGDVAVERGGEFMVTVTARNSGGEQPADLDITIRPAPPALRYKLPHLECGQTFGPVEPANDGGPVDAFEPALLPPGVTVDPATGGLSGVPTEPWDGEAQVTAVQGEGRWLVAVPMTVEAPARAATPVGLVFQPITAFVGVELKDVLPEVFGGEVRRPRRFARVALACPERAARPRQVASCKPEDGAELPQGLAMDLATGAVFGTPLAPCEPRIVPVQFFVGDQQGATELSVTVELLPPNISYEPAELVQGVRMQPLEPHNAGSPAASFVAANLPDGLKIDPATGAISGVPRKVYDGTAVVTAANDAGRGTALVPLRVRAPAEGAPVVEYPSLELHVGVKLGGVLPTTSDGGPVRLSLPCATAPLC
jgi:hypothetical protein